MKDKENIRSNLKVNPVLNYSFFSIILKQQEKLNLSTEQIEKLEKLQSEFLKETLKRSGKLQIAEIELKELQTQEPLDLGKVDAKLKQIEAFRTEIKLAYIKTIETGKAVLTPQQQKNLALSERKSLVYPDREYFSESSLHQQIQTILKKQLQDQKVVEIETAEAIAVRLSNWARLLGFFVGIPLGVLVFVLGFLGIRTYNDLTILISKIEPFKAQVALLETEVQSLEQEYEALRAKLTDYQQLEQEVKTLATRITELEDRITFKPSAVLTPELKKELEESLAKFQKYFQNLGYQSQTGQITVNVQDDARIPGLAYYDYHQENNQIVLGSSIVQAKDTDILYREYAHHVLISLVPDGDVLKVYREIESGLADYFPCSFTNDPVFAEKIAMPVFKQDYVRKLDNNFKLSDFPNDYPQIRGQIWGGAFWKIRQLLKPEVADRLLFSTWKTVTSSANLNDQGEGFVRSLLEQAKSVEGGKYTTQIRSIFAARGLKL